MAPLICLVAGFVVVRVLGLAVPYFADWQAGLRAALGLMFLLTASAHWGKRRTDLIRMVPNGIGGPGAWVSATGLAEIAIAVGLQIPQIALPTAAAGIAMLCCLFPANVKAAREHLTIKGQPVLAVAPRFVLQAIFIAALAVSVWPR